MPSGKLGEQLQVEKRQEYKVGKTTQQVGAKPTIATQQRQEEYQAKVERQQRISQSLADFQSKELTYKNYETEYDKLVEGAKPYVTSPSELKATQEYKDYKTALAQKQEYEKDKYDYEVAKKWAYKDLPRYQLETKRQREYYDQWKDYFGSRKDSTPTQNITIGYDDLGQPMSIAPELVSIQQPQQSKDFFDIIKPDIPEVFQRKPTTTPANPYVNKVDIVEPNFFSPKAQTQGVKDTALSFGEATKSFFGDIGYNIKLAFSSDSYLVKQKEFKSPGSAFREGRVNIGTIEAERKIITPQFGTATNEKGYESKSILEFETEKYEKREFETGILRTKYEKELGDYSIKLSSDVEFGKIELGKAQEKLEIKTEEINKAFQKQSSEISLKYPLKNNIYEYKAAKNIATGTTFGIETGVVLSGTINPSIPIGYFGSKGIFQAARGQQKEATINLAFAGISAGVGKSVLEKQITKLRLKELTETPLNFNIRKISSSDNKILYKVGGSKTIGSASLEVDTLIPVQQGKQESFNILSGKGKSNLRFLDYSLEGAKGNKYVNINDFPFSRYEIIKARDREIIKNSFTFTTAGSGITKKSVLGTNFGNINILNKGLSSTYGEGYYTITKGGTYGIKFGSASLKGKEGYNIFGGGLRGVRYYPKENRATALFRMNQRGKIFNENYYKSGENFFKLNPVKNKKKSLLGLEEPTLIKQPKTKSEIQALAIGSELAEKTSKRLIKESTIKLNTQIITKQSSTTLSTIVPKSIKKTSSKITPISKNKISSTINIKPKTRTITSSIIKTKPTIKTKTITRIKQPSRIRQNLKIGQKPLSKQKLSTKLISSPPSIINPPVSTPPITSKITGRRGFVFVPSRTRVPIRRTRRTSTSRRGFSISRKPSLVAVGMNIKAPSIKGRETAFSIRPIITKKKKKKLVI